MAHASAPGMTGSVNLPVLIGASILVGLGLTSLSAWMLLGSWWWLGGGVAACTIGGLVLFGRGTGADSA